MRPLRTAGGPPWGTAINLAPAAGLGRAPLVPLRIRRSGRPGLQGLLRQGDRPGQAAHPSPALPRPTTGRRPLRHAPRRHLLRAPASHGRRRPGGSPVPGRKVNSHVVVGDPPRQRPRAHTMHIVQVRVSTGFEKEANRPAFAPRTEHRPRQRRIAMTVHGIDRRPRGQQHFDDREGLCLSSKMQRSPTLCIGSPRVSALSQQHPQAIHVPAGSGIVRCGPTQSIPIRHADHPHPA